MTGPLVSIESKVAVVTGGANGIGRAIVERLAADGAAVAVLDREADALADTMATLGRINDKARGFACDLTSPAEVAQTFAGIRSTMGNVDILVNNVGQTARASASEFWCSSPETWEMVIGISLVAAMRCTREVVPTMRDRCSGRIISIASDAALFGDAGVADYAAAKGGIMGFTRSLARELAPFKVTVNAVAPGLTRTRGPAQLPKEILDAAVAAIPMKEMCEPSDIANAVAFFASDQSRMITGQLLPVNGGRVFH